MTAILEFQMASTFFFISDLTQNVYFSQILCLHHQFNGCMHCLIHFMQLSIQTFIGDSANFKVLKAFLMNIYGGNPWPLLQFLFYYISLF